MRTVEIDTQKRVYKISGTFYSFRYVTGKIEALTAWMDAHGFKRPIKQWLEGDISAVDAYFNVVDLAEYYCRTRLMECNALVAASLYGLEGQKVIITWPNDRCTVGIVEAVGAPLWYYIVRKEGNKRGRKVMPWDDVKVWRM